MIPQAWRPAKICVLCELNHHGHHAICGNCLLAFPSISFPCQRCALPLAEGISELCGQCIQDLPTTDTLIAPYPFIEPLRGLIHQYKYDGGLYLSSGLSHLMHQFIPKDMRPEVLIPMPMHDKRIRERGFNHTNLLTQHLSRWLNIPYDMKFCKKIKHTVSQASLPAEERNTNLAHTFAVALRHYQHVAIIDDVYTTGSTVQALAQSLKMSGVTRVDAWCIARTCQAR